MPVTEGNHRPRIGQHARFFVRQQTRYKAQVGEFGTVRERRRRVGLDFGRENSTAAVFAEQDQLVRVDVRERPDANFEQEGTGQRCADQGTARTPDGNQAGRAFRNRKRDSLGIGTRELQSIDVRPGKDIGPLDVRAHRKPFLEGRCIILAVAYRQARPRGRAGRSAELAGLRLFRIAKDDQQAAAAFAIVQAQLVLPLQRAQQVAGVLD